MSTAVNGTIKWEQDAGIVTLTMDDPSQSANTMNTAWFTSMKETVDRLHKEKDSIKGVILTSAKKTFFAGGDLKDLIEVKREDSHIIGKVIGLIRHYDGTLNM